MNMQPKGKTKETRQEIETSDLLLFQKSLEDRIRLYEKEKEMEGIVMNKVTLYAYYKTLQVQSMNYIKGAAFINRSYIMSYNGTELH